MKRAACVAFLVLGCRGEAGSPAPAPSASARAARSDNELAAIERAALSGRAEAVPEDALSSRDVRVRAAAARALARIADDAARERLAPLLADEAGSVLRWAAFGLGAASAGHESDVARALTVRAASLLSAERVDPDVASAFADALARSGGDEAERTLRVWLGLPGASAEAAALALGRLGARRGRLDDASLVALLDAAGRKEAPLSHALYVFTRLSPPPGALADRVLEVARATSAKPGVARAFAIRALGRAGEAGAPALGALLSDTSLTAVERAEIARELGRTGKAGQSALGAALAAWLPSSDAEVLRRLATPEIGFVSALLDALGGAETARAPLERLSRLALDGAAPHARRRAIAVRCAAAGLVAARATANAELLACDPEPGGRPGKLALIRVLGRGKLTGARGRRYRELTADADPVVRSAALRLIEGHRELEGTSEILARALADAAPGTVATAAEILAQHPDRAGEARADAAKERAAQKPDARVIEALTRAFRAASATPHVELRAALADAAGALGLLGLKADLVAACEGDNRTLRDHAERALRALGERARRCASGKPAPLPSELGRSARGTTRLVFDTDAGELALELDAERAPIAVTRIVDLARAGFFDGVAVHRFVPGFVVQLGDPGGDGYGGSERPPLVSELGPDAFEPLAVGLAESGHDSGNSQFFVALARYPHLDGEYPKLGRALPGWERLGLGDRVRRVRIEP